MTALTLIWIVFPCFLGFIVYLLPKLDRPLALMGVIVSAAYSARLFMQQTPLTLRLLDNFGVSLLLDPLAGFFILTNALVTAAVVFYCWDTGKSTFFYVQLLILHGSVNAAFVCTDFISLYVALEVISIATFLLIAYPRSDRAIWVGLRYLFVSNIAMLFYLVGAVLIYKAHHSFDFAGLSGSPPEAVALIFLGLFAKGGIFISGLWLPLTHSESESSVSALMSGIVVKASVLPLARCALLVAEVDPVVRIFGVGTALLGVFYALFEQDTKRILAMSTIAQLGFMLAAPEVAGFYALTHGLAKAALFLTMGVLPTRNLKELQQQALPRPLWMVLAIASLSICGFPLVAGFAAKLLTMKNLLPWQVIAMNIAVTGTAIVYARFIFLPHKSAEPGTNSSPKFGFWAASTLLLAGLFVANIAYYQAYTLENLAKSLGIIALGWLAYFLIFRHLVLKLPRVLEEFEHLVGVMSLGLVLIFWMVLA